MASTSAVCTFFIAACALICSVSNGAGFDYPATMPSPIDAQVPVFLATNPLGTFTYETPIQARIFLALDQVFWNCIAVYHPTAFDAATKEAPMVRAPDDIIDTYGTSETRVMCAYYADAILVDYLMPEALQSFQDLMDSYGLDSSLTSVDESVSACDVTDSQCLNNAASSKGYTPEIMGSIVAYLLIDIFQNDGYNADGRLGPDGTLCTANCNRYSDYTGYEPKLGRFHRWQPLQESNGKGFFYHYDHITPQIGPNARLVFSSREQMNRRRASDPKYDYKKETRKVVERLAETAVDDEKKMLVEFFDNKAIAAGPILLTLDIVLQWSYEERAFHLLGNLAAEYEAVIAAWNEKRRWDRVRPTTLIKQGFAGDVITTYGGPYQGLQTIKAQDFESYIRTMPHSEYPSASACICTAAQQFADAELRERYGMNSITVDAPRPSTPFPRGSSQYEPGVTPQQDIYVTFENLTEWKEACGQSRLDGGMHYTQSVEGGYEVCDGLGEMSYIYMDALERGDEAALKKLAKKGWKGGKDKTTNWQKRKRRKKGWESSS